MSQEIVTERLDLKTHLYGPISRKMELGPAKWPFHDLLWVHEGCLTIEFPDLGSNITLNAPSGILIMPNTAFTGKSTSAISSVSICHFGYDGPSDAKFMEMGYQVVSDLDKIHTQNQIRLAMHLAADNDPNDFPRRRRLLHSILDGFDFIDRQIAHNVGQVVGINPDRRLAGVWGMAARRLNLIRTLTDVAALAGITESGFRALHRIHSKTSAGQHLRDLRLKHAEELLTTTRLNLSKIAHEIGYQHTETFSTAFKKSRGLTPGEYRRRSGPFT
jgi:AraC-like DNA-binding protein